MANKTIKFGSRFGNFQWEAEAEVDDQLIDALLPLGALQVAQRSPSTAAEKALAGYEKRPKGFDRAAIPFSEKAAKTLADHLGSMKIEIGRNEKDEPIFTTLDAIVNVSEYEAPSKESQFVAERAKYASKKADAAALRKLADAVDYDGELGDGTAEGAPEGFLRAIRTWVRAQAEQL